MLKYAILNTLLLQPSLEAFLTIPINPVSETIHKPEPLNRIWQRITKPVAKNSDHARLEYMTKVILLIICVVTLPFLFLSIIGWIEKIIPLDTVIILAAMMVLFISGWVITNYGHRRIGGLIPCIVLFAAGVYGNFMGGIDAPAMLLYALAIVLAAIMLDASVQMIFLLASLISFFGMGFAHFSGILTTDRSANTMFINRVSIAFAALTAISLGVWFLKHQYQLSIKQVETSANNTRALLESIMDGIIYSDLYGTIVDLNEASLKMFGLENKQQVLGKNIVSFLSPEDQALADALHDSMLSNLSTGSITCTGILPTNEKINLEINSALFLDAAGKPTGFVSTLRNVTQRKTQEEELKKYREQLEELVTERTVKLKEAYSELESFSYSISHDLRSPLRSINGFISLVGSEPANTLTDTSLRYIEQIKESTRRMGDLITDLLDFSRLIRQPMTTQTVDPGEIARQVEEELTHGDYCELHCEIQIGKMPSCQADPVLLHQVFYNLMDNALKYSHKQEISKVWIGTNKSEEGQIIYFVKDNGIGFDMQYSNKLFGVFHRLHVDPEYEGTGIGLAIVQRIIQRHNGRIWVESKLGEGTTFFFTLDHLD
jgi:PAS domain S-box-containing protein